MAYLSDGICFDVELVVVVVVVESTMFVAFPGTPRTKGFPVLTINGMANRLGIPSAFRIPPALNPSMGAVAKFREVQPSM